MIFDGHSDIIYALNRHHQQGEDNMLRQRYLPWFQKHGVEGGIFVLWSNPDTGVPAAVQIQQQMQTLRAELEQAGDVLMMLCNAADLEQARAQQKLYFLLGAEGLDGYPQEERTIDWLYEQGVRHIGLTWNYENGFAGGVYSDAGVTAMGKNAIARIYQKRMLLDVSHLNDRSLRDVLLAADGPVIASHSNSRRLCHVPRNLTDEQIKAIAATGGVIGLNSYPAFIHCDKGKQNLEHLADHLIHIAELAGIEHTGFGFDLNYWGSDSIAEELEDLKAYKNLQPFLEYLKQRGFSASELQQISRDNFLRLIVKTLV